MLTVLPLILESSSGQTFELHGFKSLGGSPARGKRNKVNNALAQRWRFFCGLQKNTTCLFTLFQCLDQKDRLFFLSDPNYQFIYGSLFTCCCNSVVNFSDGITCNRWKSSSFSDPFFVTKYLLYLSNSSKMYLLGVT